MYLLGDGVDTIVRLEPLVWLGVILVELLGNVRADVTELLLDGLGRLKGLLWWDSRFSLPQQLLDEVSDVPTRNWNVLDAAADNIALCL